VTNLNNFSSKRVLEVLVEFYAIVPQNVLNSSFVRYYKNMLSKYNTSNCVQQHGKTLVICSNYVLNTLLLMTISNCKTRTTYLNCENSTGAQKMADLKMADQMLPLCRYKTVRNDSRSTH